MNPWLIVSWIGAICVAILIVTLTISIIAGLVNKPKTTKRSPTNIFTSK